MCRPDEQSGCGRSNDRGYPNLIGAAIRPGAGRHDDEDGTAALSGPGSPTTLRCNMSRDLFAADIDAKLEQFHLAFDRRADILMAVLRGHMMVEERLHDIISAGVANYVRPTAENDIFSFGTAAKLAHAIVGTAADANFWKGITSLNSLRNALGHRGQPVRLDKLLTKFFEDTELAAAHLFKGRDITYRHAGETEEATAVAIRLRCMALWAILGVHADNLARDLDAALMSRRPR
ncbi:hypothetical protein X880_1199 [Burkholderia pseudomallei MSHR4032]|nr:hypothetical protein X880_1199 [Burkholderia pseudomallei MSHR4032]